MNQSKRLLKIAIILDVILVEVLPYDVYRDLLGSLFVDRNSDVDFAELIESIGGMSGAEVKVEDIFYPEGNDSAGYALVRFKVLGTWQELAKTLSLVDE